MFTGSLLPKYRGAAPIQWAIINGDKKTGITTMYMNEKMDEGDILLTKEIVIEEDDTSGSLFNKLALIGADLLLETLDKIEKNEIEPIKQTGEVCYAPILDKDIAKIDWNMTACDINNLIRGLNPFLCCYTIINNKRYKIWKAVEIKKEIIEDLKVKNEIKIINNNLFIIKNRLFAETIEEFLEILEIQEEGKKALKTLDFLRGNKF